LPDFEQTLLASGAFCGRSRYLDAFPGIREPQPRIYVKFRPQGIEASFLALLDTGGHFCILNREIVKSFQDRLSDPVQRTALQTARGLIEGDLYLYTIELISEAGESLDVPATIFVSPEWHAPSFLGYSGILDRLRFSVDPGVNHFYFGAL